MLITRLHVGEMVGLQRAQMRRHDLAEAALLIFPAHDEHERARRHGAENALPSANPFSRLRRLGEATTAGRKRFLDATAQAGGRLIAERSRGHRLMHLPGVTQLCGAMWANRGMGFDFARVSGIELAVDERVHQEAGFFAVHWAFPLLPP